MENAKGDAQIPDIASTEKKAQINTRLPPNPNFFVTLSNPVNRGVMFKFWFTTISMFTIPILAYYLFNNYLFNGIIIQLTHGQRVTWSGVVAVVVVNIIMISYAIMAITTEEDKPRGQNHEKELEALKEQLYKHYGYTYREVEQLNKKNQ
ncbi:VMA21 [Acrasis kona]|uniref:VMA21 n=1 Tax=Acrasis kona TaxID=1008807 RepID=A0AAW2Z5V2_9EUKA